MATHSSIPAWRLPWTEEPGGLVYRVMKSWLALTWGVPSPSHWTRPSSHPSTTPLLLGTPTRLSAQDTPPIGPAPALLGAPPFLFGSLMLPGIF